jgi:hypothetical protein
LLDKGLILREQIRKTLRQRKEPLRRYRFFGFLKTPSGRLFLDRKESLASWGKT